MTDDLVKRLRKRAVFDREIQANNAVVAAALRGQRLLFDQDVRSASNTFAVRLCLDYERFAKNDAALAADWDEAADRIETLTADNARLRADLEPLMRYVPHSVVECRGDKCREPWCVSCFGEDDAIVALARAQTYAAVARAALTGKEPSHE